MPNLNAGGCEAGKVASDNEKYPGRWLVDVVACIVVLAALIGGGNYALSFYKKHKAVEEELTKARQEVTDKEMGDLLQDLCLPKEVMLTDVMLSQDFRAAGHRILVQKKADKIPDIFYDMDTYPKRWRSYSKPPLRIREGQFRWRSYESQQRYESARTLQNLAGEMINQRGLGLYLKQHPDVFNQHVRPLVLRLLDNLPPEQAIYAAEVLLAAGDRSEEFRNALTRLYTNPRFFDESNIRYYLKKGPFKDWVGPLEEMRAGKKQLWAGEKPELQAETIFADIDPGQDINGDPLPKGALARLGTRRFRYPWGRLDCWAFDETGKHLRMALGVRLTVVEYDVDSGRQLKNLWVPNCYLQKNVYPLRGGRVVIKKRLPRREFIVRDVAAGEDLLTFVVFEKDWTCSDVRLDPTGKYLAILRTVYKRKSFRAAWEIRDVETGEILLSNTCPFSFQRSSKVRIDFTPDGQYFVVLYGSSIGIWNRDTGWKLTRIIKSVKFTDLRVDNRTVYVSGRSKKREAGIQSFDIETGHANPEFLSRGGEMIFSEDMDRFMIKPELQKHPNTGYRIYSLPDMKAIGWVPRIGSPRTIRGDRGAVYFPDEGLLRVFDIKDNSVVAEKKCLFKPSQLLFSPDGRKLAVFFASGLSAIQVFDLENQAQPKWQGHFSLVRGIIFDTTSNHVSSWGEREFVEWEGADPMYSADSHFVFPTYVYDVGGICGDTKDGFMIAISGHGSSHPLEIRKIGSWELFRTLENGKIPVKWRFQPHSKVLAIAYIDGSINLVNVETGETIGRFFAEDRVLGMVFSSDGKWLCCRTKKQVSVWPVDYLCSSPQNSYRISESVRDIAMTSKGEKLVILNSWDEVGGYTRVIEIKTGKTVVKFWTGKTARSLAISPDNKWLAIAFDDGRVQVHSLSSGKQMIVYRGHHPRRSMVTFSPDGQSLFTTGESATILKWRLPPQCLTAE